MTQPPKSSALQLRLYRRSVAPNYRIKYLPYQVLTVVTVVRYYQYLLLPILATSNKWLPIQPTFVNNFCYAQHCIMSLTDLCDNE